MIIPILGSILVFPILVITTICCIRVRNTRARQKRIMDWVKENKRMQGRKGVKEKYKNSYSAVSSSSTKHVVRFAIPDLEKKEEDDDGDQYSLRNRRHQIKLFSDHNPVNHKGRPVRQSMWKKAICVREDKVRKDMVSIK